MVSLLLPLALLGAAEAQSPAAGAATEVAPAVGDGAPTEASVVPVAAPPPTSAEALDALNAVLDATPSPWRPCRTVATAALSDDGLLTITHTRASYCEDDQASVLLRDLDLESLVVEIADTSSVRIYCVDGAACVRQWQKRKHRVDGAWQARDDDWLARMPAGATHRTDSVVLTFGSDEQAAAQVAAALSYLVRLSLVKPEWQRAADPFNVAVAAAAATTP